MTVFNFAQTKTRMKQRDQNVIIYFRKKRIKFSSSSLGMHDGTFPPPLSTQHWNGFSTDHGTRSGQKAGSRTEITMVIHAMASPVPSCKSPLMRGMCHFLYCMLYLICAKLAASRSHPATNTLESPLFPISTTCGHIIPGTKDW